MGGDRQIGPAGTSRGGARSTVVRPGRVGAVLLRGDSADLALDRGGVPEIQRARILAGLVEVARERGAGRFTVADIVERSGVSRRTFYELFEDRDACCLAAVEEAVRRAALRVCPVFQAGTDAGGKGAMVWQERVRVALLALLEFLDEEPGLGGLCVVEALAAGPAVLAYRARVVALLVDAVDEGRGEAHARLSPSRLTAEGVVGGVLGVLYARLSEGRHEPPAARPPAPEPLVSLLSSLMAMIVLPYLGPAAATRQAARSGPKPLRKPPPLRSNPLEGLQMRLTYRTMRVLIAIAQAPDVSNRHIANDAGIHDQGQISKLLVRLEQLGLIHNVRTRAIRGAPNAWRLTARGREVAQAIHQRSAAT